MGFVLGQRSLNNLNRVHPKLVAVVQRAIQISVVDFGLPDASARTAEEQNALFRQGRSQKDGYKNKSNHQVKSDGFGHAVDLVPWVPTGRNNAYQFDWNDWIFFYQIAGAMGIASRELRTELVWGCAWDRLMSAYTPPVKSVHVAAEAMKAESRAYTIRHPGKDFLDGPHFELR
jgi:peptidoglycan L-alanyl-D-glutamate endopeptidase CwlK